MSAPLFLHDDLSQDLLVLTGAEGRHAATVRRVRVGEAVDVADGRGERAHCTVTALERDTVHLRIEVPTKLDAKQEELLRDLARLRGEEHPAASGKGNGLFGRRRR